MAWGSIRSYPRAILHIDGDSFFASCEVAKDPALRGKPVITGAERGIVSSMTYEARALGVLRAMPLHEIKKKFPQAVILPSDYETYSLFSNRMYAIVRRYTPLVEEYSIDECFADLTGMRRVHHRSYPLIAEAIRADLARELGMTFSMGLSATKVLAKIGSKYKKPDGLTLIPLIEARAFLEKTEVGKLWGVGQNTAAYLGKFGIKTAFDLASRPEAWVRERLSKPGYEIWKELNGEVVNEIDAIGRKTYHSISKTRTFTPPSRDARFVFSQLSANVENACGKARRWGLATTKIFFFLKTQEFRYHGCEIKLPHATSVPEDILSAISQEFPALFRTSVSYRATGVTLLELEDASSTQLDLFGSVARSQSVKTVYDSIDAICERYGKHTIFLGSSFKAMKGARHEGERGQGTERSRNLFVGESARKRLGIAFMGDVS